MSETRIRVAVPCEAPGGLEAQRSGHFGRSACFTVVDIESGKVVGAEVVTNPPHEQGGCMRPVNILSQQKVNAMIVEGIGGGPLRGFQSAGIAVFKGTGETANQAVDAFIKEQLNRFGEDDVCKHH